jgi:putative transposase
LDEVLSENRWPHGFSVCAVDAEGAVLDVLVQAKGNKRAALTLMRKLLNKYGLVPDKLVTDGLRSYRAAAHWRPFARRAGSGQPVFFEKETR